MPDFTSTQLIADVKRNGSVPTNQKLYTEDDFCAAFTDCQRMRIVPNILRVKEEYFVKVAEYSFDALTELSGNRLMLNLPPRAIGQRIRSLELVDANGNVLAEVPRLNPNGDLNSDFGYIFQNNQLILPSHVETTNGKLRLKYFRRPNDIVTTENCGKITAINYNTGSITLDNRPSDMIAGTTVDVINGIEPFDSKFDSIELMAGTGFTIQLDPTIAADLVIGDYVCFEQETCLPQIPVDLYPILVQYALSLILKSLKDNEGAKAVMMDLPELERNLYELLAARDDGSVKKVLLNNPLWQPRRRTIRW